MDCLSCESAKDLAHVTPAFLGDGLITLLGLLAIGRLASPASFQGLPRS